MTNGSISDFWKMKIGQKKARRPRTADFSPGFRLPIVPTDSNDPDGIHNFGFTVAYPNPNP